jgi:excisionase family DNA binding protein
VKQILSPKPAKSRTEKPTLGPKLMLTISEAASLLGIHANTLRRRSEKGLIRAYHIRHHEDRRLQREDIDSFLKGEWQLTYSLFSI